MNNNLTEIITIIDKSGSMNKIKSDVIGGFNSFIDSQKKLPGEAKVTIVLFNGSYITLEDGIDINYVRLLDEDSYVPKGSTALLDAIGRAVDSVGLRLSNTPEPERPGKVIVTIITDGEENSSREYTLEQIKEKIELQTQVYSWQFLFLGANIDAVSTADTLGISARNAVTYSASAKGIESAYATMNCALTSYRNNGEITDTWKDNIQ